MSNPSQSEDVDPRRGKPSASMLYRLALCPGSPKTSAGRFVSPQDIEMARSGQRVHDELAVPGSGELLTDSERDTVETLIYTRGLLSAEVFPGSDPLNVIVEERLWSPHGDYSAQLDWAASDGTTALVVNYKSGWGDHDAPHQNMQLAAECSLLLNTQKLQCDVAYGAILQPGKKPELVKYDKVSAVVTDVNISRMIKKAEESTTLNPSPKACRWCPNQLNCPELLKIIEEASKWKNAKEMTPEELGATLSKLSAVEGAIASFRSLAKTLLTSGEEVPGWALEDGKKVVSYPNTKDVWSAVYNAGLASQEDFMDCVHVNMPDLISAVAKKTGMKKSEAKRRVIDLLSPLAETTRRSPSLKKV